MLYFQNEQEEYLSWLERHPAGFVLNLGTGGKHQAMIHTTRCGHLYPGNPALSHTVAYPKSCSRDRDELERWGREAGYTVVPCPSCGA
jgi:hypothetical protein